MRVAVLGFDGPLAREIRACLAARSHQVEVRSPECVIYLPGPIIHRPGPIEALDQLVKKGGFRRLVLRSHAYAYGSSNKNPGMMTEDYPSRLPADSPGQRWLRAEQIAAKCSSWAAVRLTNLLSHEEGDLIVRQLAARVAASPAGYDPNVQFVALRDAARALVAAAESEETGIFNVAGDGVIPLKKALRAAGTFRAPLPRPLLHALPRSADIDQERYNWTVASEKAARELNFRAELSTVRALAEYLSDKPGARPRLLRERYDEWGLDAGYIEAWNWWFTILRKVYWRIDVEGMEHIPRTGRAMFVASHRGFLPLDAVIHLYLILRHRGRIVRFLIIPSLLSMPFMCNFLTKLGGVIANQQNAAQLFAGENLVGIFPEGIRGTFTPYRSAYRLRDFTKSAFAKIAIENQAPIIPAAVIGHAEIFPILGRIESKHMKRVHGWPYFPIAPPFPLAPIPLPSKWHVRILEPIPLDGLAPADAENPRLVRDFGRYVQNLIQINIDDMLKRRSGIFLGCVLDGTGPASSPFNKNVPSPKDLPG